jgi:hypothetical protein
VVSNIIGIIIQYFVGGGWGYFTLPSFRPQPQAAAPQNQPSKALKEGNEKKKGQN